MLLKTIIPPTQTKMPKQPKPPLPILVEVLTYSNVRHAISHVADRSAAAPRISGFLFIVWFCCYRGLAAPTFGPPASIAS